MNEPGSGYLWCDMIFLAGAHRRVSFGFFWKQGPTIYISKIKGDPNQLRYLPLSKMICFLYILMENISIFSEKNFPFFNSPEIRTAVKYYKFFFYYILQ